MPLPNPRNARTILIVEDNPVGRKLFRLALNKEGFSVKEAGTAAEALKLVREAAPDLIIQDLMIEGTDGIQLALDYRKLPGGDNIPIIAVSGSQPGLVLAKAVQIGFVDYLAKPIDIAKLIDVVRTHLPNAEQPHNNGRKRTVIVADDNPMQRKLIRAFLEGSGFTVHAAKDGLEALEMVRKLKPNAMVCDVFMPQLDGFGVCKSVRLDPAVSKTPIILYSSVLDDPADRVFAKLAGANEFVTKGQAEYLIEALERALDAPEHPPLGELDLEAVESAQRALRQAELQGELNVRLVRRLGVQEIELALLSQVLRLSATSQLKAFPPAVLESCLSAGQVRAAAIFLRRPSGKVQLSTAFGFPQEAAALRKFYGYVHLIEEVIRDDRPFNASEQQPLSPKLAKLFSVLGPRILITPLSIEKQKLGALVALPAQDADDYFERFVQSVGRYIALAVNLTQVRKRTATQGRRP